MKNIDNIQEIISLKAKEFIQELSRKVLERDELAGLITLAIFSAQNMFLIGKPGVGKTKLLKLAIKAVENTKSFEHLMMHDTKSEAIFGTSVVDSSGELVHRFQHTAITAHYILMDEFFKGSSEIINGFLGIASEDRTYHPGGGDPLKVPLRTLFVASNEFHKSEALEAMNDRLPLRYEVKRIQNDENFYAMVENNFDLSSEFRTIITLDIIDYVSKEGIREVLVPRELTISYTELKKKLISEENIEASDRRLMGAIVIMKASAYLNNRNSIDESDFFLLNHIIWNDYGERERTQRAIYRHLFSSDKYVKKLLQDAQEDFEQLSSMKQVYLNDFLMKKSHIPVSEINDYFERHIGMLHTLMQKLNESYVKIEDIYRLKENNERIRLLIAENIFVPNMKDTIFSTELSEEISKCDRDYQYLYAYLVKFKENCPNARAYINYTGNNIENK